MKVLDVKELQDGIDQFIREIDASFERISRVQRAVRNFHALDDALKGEGGDALRNFFNDCHQPFLVYLFQSLIDFKHALEKIKEATQSYESHHHGFVSEEFLQNDVEAGLDKVAETTIDLTDEANSIIASVQDIVAIEKIDETEVLDNVQRGKGKSREIIEDLYHLDDYGTSLLEKTKEDLDSMHTYIFDLESKFSSGDLSVKNYHVKAIHDMESRQTIVGNITNKEEEFDKIEASPAYQKILQQNEMTPEELATIKAYLEGEGYKDEKYSIEDYELPDYGPITYWDRLNVMGGGPSSLSGSPDGLAGIATSGFDFFTDDIVTVFHPESTVSERMLAGLFSLPAFKPAKFLKPMDDVVGGVGKVGKGAGNSKLSPSNYPNPDPPMSIPPVRYESKTIEEVIRMRQGKGPTTKMTHGDKNIEAHHRQQVPVKNGGILDELEQRIHRGGGNHTRHDKPSQLTPSQRAKEIREHYKERGKEYILPGEGI